MRSLGMMGGQLISPRIGPNMGRRHPHFLGINTGRDMLVVPQESKSQSWLTIMERLRAGCSQTACTMAQGPRQTDINAPFLTSSAHPPPKGLDQCYLRLRRTPTITMAPAITPITTTTMTHHGNPPSSLSASDGTVSIVGVGAGVGASMDAGAEVLVGSGVAIEVRRGR